MPRKRSSSTRPRLQKVSIRVEPHKEVDWDRYAFALLQYTKLVSGDNTKQPPADRKHQP
jgi:hypothetical protein